MLNRHSDLSMLFIYDSLAGTLFQQALEVCSVCILAKIWEQQSISKFYQK